MSFAPIRVGLVGEEESQIWLGQRRFDLVVRLRDDRRDTLRRDPHAADRRPRRTQDSARPARRDVARRSVPPRSGAKPARAGSRSKRRSADATSGSTAADVRRALSRPAEAAGRLLLRPRRTGREPGARVARADAGDRRRPVRRVRAAPDGARFGSRSGRDPRHGPDRVRRRHPRAADRRRDLERLLPRRTHRAVRHRGAEQPGAGHADARTAGRGPHRCARRSARPASAASGRS